MKPNQTARRPMSKTHANNLSWNLVGLVSGVLLALAFDRLLGGFLIGAGTIGIVETLRAVNRERKAGTLDAFAKDSTGVSPVIGVILMVAITVVLAAIVFVLVSNLGDVADPPNLALKTTDGGGNFTVVAVSEGVRWSDLRFGPGTACAPWIPAGAVYVEAGDVIECDPAGELNVVHRPSHTLIYSYP